MADENAQTPPWGDDFDASRAWTLVQNLRTEKSTLQASNAELVSEKNRLTSELATAQSEVEKVSGELNKVKTESTRKSIMDEFGLTDEEVGDLFDGLDEAGLRKRAERLAALAGKTRKDPKDKDKSDDKDKDADGQAPDADKDQVDEKSEPSEPDAGPLVRKPRPALVPGTGSDTPADVDLGAMAAEIRKRTY